MKKVIVLTVCLFIVSLSFAAPLNKAIRSGLWSNTASWSLTRLPQVGDTIDIPAGITIIINDDQVLNGFVYLNVAGTLEFQNNNSTLRLGSSATVVVANGRIRGGGNASQKLRLGNNTIFAGNQPDITGFQMANGSTNGFIATQAPLPVHLIAFTATRKAGDVLVQWSTMTELAAQSFEVERSFDGQDWEMVGSVRAVGNSNSIQNYSFTDRGVMKAVAYYRVKQVDINGRFQYTIVRSVKADGAMGVTIAANTGNVVLQFASATQNDVFVRIISYSGNVISERRLSKAFGQVVVPTQVRGNYIVVVSGNDGIQASRQVML